MNSMQQKSEFVSFLTQIKIVRDGDVSPQDFWGFGHLKQKMWSMEAKSFDDMIRILHEVWSTFDRDLVETVYDDWKVRLKLLIEQNGGHIEQVSRIHRRKLRISVTQSRKEK